VGQGFQVNFLSQMKASFQVGFVRVFVEKRPFMAASLTVEDGLQPSREGRDHFEA
jgi:hypothetical protein